MAAQHNQMVTFQDLQDLITFEGFVLNNPFTPSNLCADKLEVIAAINIVESNLDGLADNQLVQRSLIEKVNVPIDTPPTSTTVILDSISYTTADTSWSGATDDVSIDYYDLYILYPGDSSPTFIVRLDSTENTYTFIDLLENNAYTFYVVAIDNIGQSDDFTGFVIGNTLEDLNPTAPTLVLVSKNTNTIVLGWSGATDDVAISGYKVYENNILIGTIVDETYTHIDLNTSTLYSYHIVTVDSVGQISPNSNTLNVTTDAEVSADPPIAPTNITVLDRTANELQILIEGASAVNGIKGYNIYARNEVFKIFTISSTVWIPNLTHGSLQHIYVETVDNVDVVSLTKYVEGGYNSPSAPSERTDFRTLFNAIDSNNGGVQIQADRCLDLGEFRLFVEGDYTGKNGKWSTGETWEQTNEIFVNPTRTTIYSFTYNVNDLVTQTNSQYVLIENCDN